MADNEMHVKNTTTWVRLAYMVLFSVLLMAGRSVISLIVLAQFLLVLVTGKDNDNLRNLGQGLGQWVYQTIMFLTFNAESKPFPFDEWPVAKPTSGYSSVSVETGGVADTQEDSDELSDSSIPSFVASDDADNEDETKPKKGK